MNFFKKLFGKKNKDSKIVQTQSISQPDKKEVLTDVNGLTEKEIEICKKASIDIADAGLLK